MRPGEVVMMRVCDIDTNPDAWIPLPVNDSDSRGRLGFLVAGSIYHLSAIDEVELTLFGECTACAP